MILFVSLERGVPVEYSSTRQGRTEVLLVASQVEKWDETWCTYYRCKNDLIEEVRNSKEPQIILVQRLFVVIGRTMLCSALSQMPNCCLLDEADAIDHSASLLIYLYACATERWATSSVWILAASVRWSRESDTRTTGLWSRWSSQRGYRGFSESQKLDRSPVSSASSMDGSFLKAFSFSPQSSVDFIKILEDYGDNFTAMLSS